MLKRCEALSETAIDSNGNRKRKREGKFNSMDEALLFWFKQAPEMNAPLNRGVLKVKAKNFAQGLGISDFVASDGWLSRWKERNGIVYKKLQGEKQDCDVAGAENWLKLKWPPVLQKYDPQNIFNLNETALYYRATPDHCLIFKNSEATAGKKMKDQLTVLLLCNMTGLKKIKPLVLGKSRIPRCFNGVKNLPVNYAINSKAWMTSTLFADFL